MTLLSVQNLRKAFGGVEALAGVSFELRAGEVLAMIGPNGAGKTTCFNILDGQLRPDVGDIFVDGRNITGWTPHRVAHLGVGRTFQISATFTSMTVRENVQTALLSYQRRLGAWWTPAASFAVEEANALLEQVGLADQAARASSVLAYGDRKRLEVAMALANSPRLLLMDEPTAGVAPGERSVLMRMVTKLATERQIGLLFTEHDMDVVFGHAARVIVLSRGEVVAEGTPEAVRANPTVRAVYLGGAAPAEA
jgi:branched-chain amino acid transport system ATP-binding protein